MSSSFILENITGYWRTLIPKQRQAKPREWQVPFLTITSKRKNAWLYGSEWSPTLFKNKCTFACGTESNRWRFSQCHNPCTWRAKCIPFTIKCHQQTVAKMYASADMTRFKEQKRLALKAFTNDRETPLFGTMLLFRCVLCEFAFLENSTQRIGGHWVSCGRTSSHSHGPICCEGLTEVNNVTLYIRISGRQGMWWS